MTDAVYARADADSAVIAELSELLGDRLSTTMAVREHHGHLEHTNDKCPPTRFPLSNHYWFYRDLESLWTDYSLYSHRYHTCHFLLICVFSRESKP